MANPTELPSSGSATSSNKLTGKPKRKRKAGDYRYQVRVDAVDGRPSWYDSSETYKGPTEALSAGEKEGHAGEIIRVVRIASKEFEVSAETKTVLKPRTT